MAARFWVNGGVDNNWSTIGNWSLTSGGAGGQAVPTNADAVTFDSGGNVPCTLNTSARVCLSLTVTSGYTSTITFSQNLSCSGSITLANAAYTLTGAGLLRMIAAGTWTTNGKTVAVAVEIGGTTTFTCTLADALTVGAAFTLTNTTSTIFSGAFAITATSCTVSGSQTVTIVADVTISGLTTIADACVINGVFNWNTAGLTVTGATTGTTTFVFNGTGTWQGAASLSNNVTINTAGTLTLSGTILYLAGTITWTAGTVSAGASTLSIGSSCTLNTNGMTWANIILTAALTLTINSLLLVGGTLTLPNAAVTFAGTAGFTVGTLTNTALSATRITTFGAGLTYTVTGSMTTEATDVTAEKHTWKSSSAGTKAIITLGPGATQDLAWVDVTDIDSSAGQTIFSFRGATPATSFNWIVVYPVNCVIRPSYQIGV